MKLPGMRSLAQRPRTIRSGLDGGRAARTQPPASAMIPLSGRLPSRRVCAGNLVGSNMARGRSTPSLRLVGKQVIVKINDVGPLTPGRIIDLNERAMRYFDPSLQLGVIYDVIVRPLFGDYWISGPVG